MDINAFYTGLLLAAVVYIIVAAIGCYLICKIKGPGED